MNSIMLRDIRKQRLKEIKSLGKIMADCVGLFRERNKNVYTLDVSIGSLTDEKSMVV